MKTIISGIEKLSKENEDTLGSISSFEYANISSKDELRNAFLQCDIFWFRLNHKITKDIVKDSKCKYILCAVTGLDHIDELACKNYGISIISLRGEEEFLKEVRATAEHTLGLLLVLIRKSMSAFDHVKHSLWNRNLFQGYELYRKNVGIMGMGRLGKIMAGYYHSLGMNVYYFDPKESSVDNRFIELKTPKELFEKSDVLSLHISYNSANHEIVNKSLLKYVKPTCFIVNTARGGIVNEDDILTLLKEKKLAGYATDVLQGEPVVRSNPLIEYSKTNDNIIITPHLGGYTYESIEKTEQFILDKLIHRMSHFN